MTVPTNPGLKFAQAGRRRDRRFIDLSLGDTCYRLPLHEAIALAQTLLEAAAEDLDEPEGAATELGECRSW